MPEYGFTINGETATSDGRVIRGTQEQAEALHLSMAVVTVLPDDDAPSISMSEWLSPLTWDGRRWAMDTKELF